MEHVLCANMEATYSQRAKKKIHDKQSNAVSGLCN